MIKNLILDVDGVVIKRGRRFSERFCDEFSVPIEKLMPFFKNEFQQCIVGKSDLKEEIAKYLKDWRWGKSTDELLAYWFEGESEKDERILKAVKTASDEGVNCHLATNNEKYRTLYLWDSLKLKDCFRGIFSSAELGDLKSEPEFWEKVHSRLGKPNKDQITVWDDDRENVRAAESFGFQAKFYDGFESFRNRMSSMGIRT